MAVHLALQVTQLEQVRELVLARGRDLAVGLAQLGRDEVVAEVRVQLLLGRVRDDLVRLHERDPVFRDREPAPHGVLAQGDVVVLRAREVLEDVPVALVRHDAEVEAKAVVRADGRLRVAASQHFRDPLGLAERGDERRGVSRGRDHVNIADRLLAATDTAGFRDREQPRRAQCKLLRSRRQCRKCSLRSRSHRSIALTASRCRPRQK